MVAPDSTPPSPSSSDVPRPPAWKEALDASRHTWLPILFLQMLIALLVLGFFLNWPIDLPLRWLADLHTAGGLLFSFIAAGIAGGVLSEITYVIFLQHRQWHRENFEDMIFKFLLLGLIGALTDLLYWGQNLLFGSEPGWLGIAGKVAFDQLLFCPFVSSLIIAVLCDWYKDGFARARIEWWFRQGYYTAVILPVLITNWFFWVPMSILIYSLPALLQTALYLLALACWGVLLTVLEQEMGIDPDVPRHYTGLEINRGRFNFSEYRRSPFGRLSNSDFEIFNRVPPTLWQTLAQRPLNQPVVLQADKALELFKLIEDSRKDRDLLMIVTQWRLQNQTVHIQGDIRLPSTVSRLPDNLVFLDNLDASGSNIQNFDSVVKGDANFAGSNIKNIGPNAHFEGHLDASNTPNLRKFMGVVQGDANFSGSHIHTIARTASISGQINTANTPNLPASHNFSRPTESQVVKDVHSQAQNEHDKQQQQQQHGPKAL